MKNQLHDILMSLIYRKNWSAETSVDGNKTVQGWVQDGSKRLREQVGMDSNCVGMGRDGTEILSPCRSLSSFVVQQKCLNKRKVRSA